MRSVPEFWRRLGGPPAVAGQRVLEIGSGHGALALELAGAGADVVGLDVNPELVAWACAHVATREVAGRLRFLCQDVRTLEMTGFDLVVSKDTFEHVEDIGATLIALRTRLTAGGRIYVGFSPLFYSPWGDHGEAGERLPWAHAVSRRRFLRAAGRRRGEPVRSLAEVGLNGITPAQFRRAVAGAGLGFETLRYNVSDRRLMRVMSVARRVPVLERYATVSIYAVLVPR